MEMRHGGEGEVGEDDNGRGHELVMAWAWWWDYEALRVVNAAKMNNYKVRKVWTTTDEVKSGTCMMGMMAQSSKWMWVWGGIDNDEQGKGGVVLNKNDNADGKDEVGQTTTRSRQVTVRLERRRRWRVRSGWHTGTTSTVAIRWWMGVMKWTDRMWAMFSLVSMHWHDC
jgi:hypothetical protein